MRKSIIAICFFMCLLVAVPFAYGGQLAPGDLMSKLVEGEPSDELTRGEFAFMLATASGHSGVLPGLSDENTNYLYDVAIKELSRKGIVRGYADGTLRPDQTVTRVEAVVMLSRMLGLPVLPAKDIVVKGMGRDHWAAGPYTWCVKEGFLTADADPGGEITRLEGDKLLVGAFATNQLGRELNKKSEEALRKAQTMRIDGKMDMTMELTPELAGQVKGGNMNFDVAIRSDMNLKEGIRQVMTMTLPTVDNVKLPDMTIEQYYTPQGMYMKMNDPMTGESMWVKYPESLLPDFESIMGSQSTIANAEMDELFYYRVLGDTMVNGKQCYQIAFYGRVNDFSQLMSILSSNMPDGLDDTTRQMLESTKGIINSMSIMGVYTLDKGSYLPVKMSTQAVVTFNQKLLNEQMPFTSMRAEYQLNYRDFNTNIKIQLPEEALEAEVLPI